jgi:hypothetical protein
MHNRAAGAHKPGQACGEQQSGLEGFGERPVETKFGEDSFQVLLLKVRDKGIEINKCGKFTALCSLLSRISHAPESNPWAVVGGYSAVVNPDAQVHIVGIL